jgi:hypothetical protein
MFWVMRRITFLFCLGISRMKSSPGHHPEEEPDCLRYGRASPGDYHGKTARPGAGFQEGRDHYCRDLLRPE